MTADPAPSTETLTLELRTPTARRVLLGPPSKFMRGIEQRREWLAAIEAEARQQGAAEERARTEAYRHLYERVVGDVDRVRRYVAGNLEVWSDDKDTNLVSAAVCDVYQKVLNVIDMDNPLASPPDAEPPAEERCPDCGPYAPCRKHDR